MLQQTGATNRWVVSRHQVSQVLDREPVRESPLQLNMGVRRLALKGNDRMKSTRWIGILAAASLASAPLAHSQATPDSSGITLSVPDSIGAFRMIHRKDFEEAADGVMLRYHRAADSLQADVFAYAGPAFDAECDSACAREVLRREGDEFVAAFPELQRLGYVDTITVASDRTLTPPAGAPWRMGRHLRFHQHRQGRPEWSDFYLYYLPGYRVKIRASYPPDSTRAVAAGQLAAAVPQALTTRAAASPASGKGSSPLSGIAITTTLHGTPQALRPVLLNLLARYGYTVEDSGASGGRIVTAPRYAWPKGSEKEIWHGKESPGVRLFVTLEPRGDSTTVAIGGQSPTRPNWSEPKVAETLQLLSIMELTAALPESKKSKKP